MRWPIPCLFSLSEKRLLMISIQVFLIAVAAAAIGVVLPGYVAYQGKVFYAQQFQDTLKHRREHPERFEKPLAYEEETNRLRASMEELARTIDQPSFPEDRARLVQLYQEIETRVHGRDNVIVPFYGGPFIALWFWTFLTIGVLRFCVPATCAGLKEQDGVARSTWANWKACVAALVIGVCICFFYQWPSLGRTFRPRGVPGVYEPSVVFYQNLDANPLSFAVEQFLNVLYGVLLASVWMKWVASYENCQGYSERLIKEAPRCGWLASAVNHELAARLSRAFVIWVVASVLLASSYLFDTIHYWHAVSRPGGNVYVPSAVLEHVVWAVSWVVISLPLISLWRCWSELRARALEEMAESGLDEGRQRLLAEAKPLSTWLVVAANAGAVATWMASLLHSV